MRVCAAALTACLLGALAAGCGGSSSDSELTPEPAPTVTLTQDEKQVWAPLPPDRSEIPVLLYHGIGDESDFSNAADASYGIDVDAFARQMTEIAHAGYQTVDLDTFAKFVAGKSVHLPPRPLLLTFDDGRKDSWTGSQSILNQLGFNAVLFVDVGRVNSNDPEYLSWSELQTVQEEGGWLLQLHSGHGHRYIKYGLGADDSGPYYAYEEIGENFKGWKKRAEGDIEWGESQLVDHVRGYQPIAFAPPYGTYGQDGTNDPDIPPTLLGWLDQKIQLVFTQDESVFAKPGTKEPIGRIQITRAMTGGDLHSLLVPSQ